MSTILEALKKSEQERKLNKLPTLSDMPPPQEPSRLPVILLIVISVLLAALLAFLVILWWSGQEPVPAARVLNNETLGVAAEPEAINNASDIRVNVISYSSDPAQRFAMVNGKVVREGDFVRPGLRLEQIESSSVTLNLRGEQIKLTP